MDPRTPHRTRLASGIVLVGLLAAAGCGNNPAPSGGSVVKPAGSSSESATASTPAKAASSGRTLNAGDFFTKTYAATMKAGTAHMSMTMSGAQASTMQGDVSYAAGNPSMQMTMSVPQASGKIEMRLVDKVLYMQIPSVVPPGKFLAIDSRDTSSPLAKTFGSYTDQMDPMKSLQNLKGSIKSVKATGTENIDGTPTTKYHVVVDTAKALAKLKTQMPQAAQSMPPTIEYDLFMDSKNLMRRMEFTLASMTMQMDLTRWGQRVDIAKPPASAIVKQPGA